MGRVLDSCQEPMKIKTLIKENTMIEEIKRLKEEKDVVILAHY